VHVLMPEIHVYMLINAPTNNKIHQHGMATIITVAERREPQIVFASPSGALRA